MSQTRYVWPCFIVLGGVLGIWFFLRLTETSPFEFTDKAFFRPLVNISYPELQELDKKTQQTEQQLQQLPSPKKESVSGTSGLYLKGNDAPLTLRWKNPQLIDAVSIVPARHPNPRPTQTSWALPQIVEVKCLLNKEVLKHFQFAIEADSHRELRGVLPYFLEFEPLEVDAIEIEINPEGKPQSLALAEVFVFNGARNLAPAAALHAPSSREGVPGVSLDYVIDEQTPLGLPQKLTSHPLVGYLSRGHQNADDTLWVIYSWQDPQRIDELRLYPIERLLGMPMSSAGFPAEFKVQIWNPQSSSWETVGRKSDESLDFPGLNPISTRFPARETRRLRLYVERLWQASRRSNAILALAEIECRYQGLRLSGEEPQISFSEKPPPPSQARRAMDGTLRHWAPRALKDGMTTEGRILHERDWLQQLSKRAELAIELQKYSQQRDSLQNEVNRLCWRVTSGIPLLLLSTGIALFIRVKHKHSKTLRTVKNQLAADLHDDLGSNLSAIGAYAEQVKRQIPSEGNVTIPSQYAPMERLIRESLGSLKEMISVTSPHITKQVPLVERLKEVADIHRSGLELDFTVEPGLEAIEIQQTQRRTLRLLLKEALNNSIRHSSATKLEIRIQKDDTGTIWMHIRDNGRGVSEKDAEWLRTDSTLRMRADENNAQFDAQLHPEGGTVVSVSIDPKSIKKMRGF